MPDKFNGDVNKVEWKKIFSERRNLHRQVDEGINDILCEQKGRPAKAERIVLRGYDAKDALLENLNVEDSVDDVLARRYYSSAVLELLHRNIALQEWVKLSKGENVPLEKALAGFDLFVVQGRKGDYDEISTALDNVAELFQQEVPMYPELDTRDKAKTLARYLRAHNLMGIKCNVHENYHNIQNNFLGIALQDPDHPSLPLISVAIYCCVAQRLGLDAQPCGFLFHVLAIVNPPKGFAVDGRELYEGQMGDPIYMDPFRSMEESLVDDLKSQLVSLGVTPNDHATYLGSSSTVEIVRRSAKNIVTSVQTMHRNERANQMPTAEPYPEMDAAFYSSIWALTILAEGDRDGLNSRDAANSQRAQFLPYILQQMESKFPMDISLIEKFIVPLSSDLTQPEEISNSIRLMRDSERREVKTRTLETSRRVRFKIGQYFQHKRYRYFAFITGWDVECLAGEAWISRMGVDQLARGKHQSFYHVK